MLTMPWPLSRPRIRLPIPFLRQFTHSIINSSLPTNQHSSLFHSSIHRLLCLSQNSLPASLYLDLLTFINAISFFLPLHSIPSHRTYFNIKFRRLLFHFNLSSIPIVVTSMKNATKKRVSAQLRVQKPSEFLPNATESEQPVVRSITASVIITTIIKNNGPRAPALGIKTPSGVAANLSIGPHHSGDIIGSPGLVSICTLPSSLKP